MTAVPPGRVGILGVGVDPLTMDNAVATIADWIDRGEPNYVCVTTVYGIMLSQEDADFRAIHNRAGMVTADGMPLVWVSRLQGAHDVDRVYGPDLMLAVFARSQTTGWRHYLYGGTPAALARLEANLRARFPGAQVVGRQSPPFRALTDAERGDELRALRRARPDIVWVGLGTPKQERWMASTVDELDGVVLVGVGAAFDFHAGVKRQAPRWMQRSGLEWLFRLSTEPRRLAGRYLRHNPRFVGLVAASLLRGRH